MSVLDRFVIYRAISGTFSCSMVECWLARSHEGIVPTITAVRSSCVQLRCSVWKTLYYNSFSLTLVLTIFLFVFCNLPWDLIQGVLNIEVPCKDESCSIFLYLLGNSVVELMFQSIRPYTHVHWRALMELSMTFF